MLEHPNIIKLWEIVLVGEDKKKDLYLLLHLRHEKNLLALVESPPQRLET